MQLPGGSNTAFRFRISVKGCFLMRVFTIAEILDLYISLGKDIRQPFSAAIYFFCHVIGNGAVIQSCMEKSFS